MFNSLADLVLWSNIIGFSVSFILNILYNLIQKKNSREMISFGTVMGWGIFLSLILFIFFVMKDLNL